MCVHAKFPSGEGEQVVMNIATQQLLPSLIIRRARDARGRRSARQDRIAAEWV